MALSSSMCHTVSCGATSLLSIERIRDCCKKEQPEAPCRLTERGACGAADRADALLRWSVDPEGRGPAREGGQGVTQPAVWRQDMHGWSGYDDVGRGGHASFHGLFVLFCAWVRFNSDPFNACNGEAIWGVVEVGSMENMQEGRREAAGEQSADDVCAWVDGARGVDCSNDKKLAIIVC